MILSKVIKHLCGKHNSDLDVEIPPKQLFNLQNSMTAVTLQRHLSLKTCMKASEENRGWGRWDEVCYKKRGGSRIGSVNTPVLKIAPYKHYVLILPCSACKLDIEVEIFHLTKS
jgi:hypothetical protein